MQRDIMNFSKSYSFENNVFITVNTSIKRMLKIKDINLIYYS